MAKYSITNKGNIVKCKSDCKATHEHYEGSFDNAVKYFQVDQQEIKSYGKLLNILIYQQTSEKTTKKLSNELFDILMNAQSTKKYYSIPEDREQNALDAISAAENLNIIYDDEIVDKLMKSDRNQSHFRVKLYKNWFKKYG